MCVQFVLQQKELTDSLQINMLRFRILISVAKCSGLSKEAGKHRTLWFPIHDVGQIAPQADQSGGAGPTGDSAAHGERRSPAQSQLTVRRRTSPTSTAKHTPSRLVLTDKASFTLRDCDWESNIADKWDLQEFLCSVVFTVTDDKHKKEIFTFTFTIAPCEWTLINGAFTLQSRNVKFFFLIFAGT